MAKQVNQTFKMK